ncbi:hypothetical protein FDP41_003538 [Naegleria fowleri]|uniref:Uncharacterized protein n=1 Tax=Naegleria fowleri TaxID=5763 RepID=A0A6A5BR18_NAEFO|nr:uncharacterized protein FDP41_003538 [Naegleria fowleri]KAF0977546.1 hypothetical protein FDP41_003538 [Naegleria fowleri]
MQSRVETMIELFPNNNDMQDDDDDHLGINRMYSSFEHFTSETGKNYLFVICNGFKTAHVWEVETNSCICTLTTDEDALFIHACPVISFNKFLIFQSDGSVLLLTVESETHSLDPVHIDHNCKDHLCEEVCNNMNDTIVTRQIMFQDDHVLLAIKTPPLLMLCSLYFREENIQLNYLSHVDMDSSQLSNFDLLGNKDDDILIVVPMDKDLSIIRVQREPTKTQLQMANSIKLIRKGSSIDNCLLFNGGDIIVASSSTDSSILRFEMN